MDIQIITENLMLDIYGFSGVATNKDYVGAVFQFSGRMWELVKAKDIKNKGKNIWVYESGDRVFAGVELENNSAASDDQGFERKTISFSKYAYFKHVGPYHLIRETGSKMRTELNKKGLEAPL